MTLAVSYAGVRNFTPAGRASPGTVLGVPANCLMTPHSEDVSQAIRRNIETIARLEEEYNKRRTTGDRIADTIGDFSGSIAFVVVHAVLIGGWIAFNLKPLPGMRSFDPFPFMFLGAAVSIEAIFLSTFVLIKQSRMSRRADERAHLDLQINLLAEREMTLVLQMLHAVCTKMGLEPLSGEITELAVETPVEAVANELQKAISDEQKITS